MRKTVLLLLTCFLTTALATAAPVSQAEALQTAQSFFSSRGKLLSSISAAPARRDLAEGPAEAAPYYVFNLGGDGGFVVVSGDDRTVPVLGYADSGYLDLNHLPDGLQDLLDGYSAEMATLKSGSVPSVSSGSFVKAPVAPLVKTHWNQDYPYSENLPLIMHSGELTRAATGCVATAMAQIMKYHSWPQSACLSIPSYLSEDIDSLLPELPPVSFDWANMKYNYTTVDSVPEEIASVALLMEYCGHSVEMNYGYSSSSYSQTIPEALKTFFGYDKGARFVQRNHYTYSDWVQLLYDELAAGRPIVYSAKTVSSGHSFICDGYDQDDYFHFNWGWSGNNDGYFRLTSLNPYDQGTGGSSTRDGYNIIQGAVVGMQPDTQPSGKNYGLYLDGTDAFDYQGTQWLYLLMYSYEPGTHMYDITSRLYLEDGTYYCDVSDYSADSISLSYVDYYQHYWTAATLLPPYKEGNDILADGTYQVRFFSRYTGTEEWKELADWESQPIILIVTNGRDSLVTPRSYYYTPEDATFTIEGDSTVGSPLTVIAHVTGPAEHNYFDNLVLYVNGEPTVGQQADVLAGQTVDVVFTYVPTTVGNDTLTLRTNRSKKYAEQIGEERVVAISGNDLTSLLNLNRSITIHNLNGEALYGNRVRVTARLENPSTESDFTGMFRITLWEWDPETETEETIFTDRFDIIVAKDSFLTFEYDIPNLRTGYEYSVGLSYRHQTLVNGTPTNKWLHKYSDYYPMSPGFTLYSADGTYTIGPAQDTIDCGDAVCADLSGMALTGSSVVTLSSDPYCLYLVNDSAVVSAALSAANLVVGETAAHLSLDDGHGFYSPVRFVAESASYTRIFESGISGDGGWSTLYLPFDVTAVTCEGLGSVDWFHSEEETGKQFRLCAFAGEGPSTIVFEDASSLKANRPYLIAVPGADRGAGQMTGKVVTFSGTNVEVAPSVTTPLTGEQYKFVGSTLATTQQKVYVLNETGSAFVLQETAQTAPFRAWLTNTNLNPEWVSELAIDTWVLNNQSMGVETTEGSRQCRKVLINGQLYILREGKRFDVLGTLTH